MRELSVVAFENTWHGGVGVLTTRRLDPVFTRYRGCDPNTHDLSVPVRRCPTTSNAA